MPPTTEIRVRVVPQTDQLATALDIIAKHAQACAAELREANLPQLGYVFSGPADDRDGVDL